MINYEDHLENLEISFKLPDAITFDAVVKNGKFLKRERVMRRQVIAWGDTFRQLQMLFPTISHRLSGLEEAAMAVKPVYNQM